MVEIEIEYDRRLNLALQQNAVPVVKSLHLHNRGESAVEDVTLELRVEPGLSARWRQSFSELAPASSVAVEHVDLQLLPERLVELTERTSGRLVAELRREEELLVEHAEPLEILAYNEWGGFESLPELLAAFVLPNHPALDEVLGGARELLQRRTGDPALNGYQSKDPRRVRALAEAIYSALQQRGITYVTPPASFERSGQKVRTAEQILDSRMGTCLDLTLLIAAALEQVGLNPLVIIIEGHAFVGLWLVDSHFPEPAIEDPLRLRKRVELDDICLVDATALATRPLIDFDAAVEAGRALLAEPEQFLMAIDVRTAREYRILPLPARLGSASFSPSSLQTPASNEPSELATSDAGDTAASRATADQQSEAVTFEAGQPQPANASEVAETPGRRRVERWKEQLLDLTLRNRLLNYRETKKHVPLLCADLPALEDVLSRSKQLELRPKPALLDKRDPRDPTLLSKRTGSDPLRELLCDELEAKRLRTPLTEAELAKRLTNIFREARTSLQEGGANVLYLALGFLAWRETPGSDTERLAPLLLLPLKLIRGHSAEPFKLELAGEEPRLNVTLLKKLEVEFGITIEGITELPEDDSGLDIHGIFQKFRRAVVEMEGFEVREQAVVGLFSFTKFLMWRDLEDRSASLLHNDVVRFLVEGDDRPFTPATRFLTPEELDEQWPPTELLTTVDADSSQLAAVVAADDGASFVLEGPPGTGKSQTITNLIAHCLARGRTVLFVSEKMAALEVVHGRLTDVGLGPFCLELHSNKTRKADAVAQLGAALDARGARMPAKWAQQADELLELRRELNRYAQAIHQPRSFGESLFTVTSRLVALGEGAKIDLELRSPEELTSERLDAGRDAVAQLRAAAGEIGRPGEHPWRAVQRGEWTPQLQRELTRQLEEQDDAARRLRDEARRCSEAVGLPAVEDSHDDLRRLDELAKLLLESPPPPRPLLLPPDQDACRAEMRVLLEHGHRHAQLQTQLDEQWQADRLLQLDLDGLRQKYQRWSGAFFLIAWLMLFFARRALASALSQGRQLPAKEAVIDDLDRAMALRSERDQLRRLDDRARARLGETWRGLETSWEAVAQSTAWCQALEDAVAALGRRIKRGGDAAQERIRQLAFSATSDDATTGRRLDALRSFREAFARYDTGRRALIDELTLLDEDAWGRTEDEGHLERVIERLRLWREAPGALRDWCAYRRAASAMGDAGLTPLFKAHLGGRVTTSELTTCLERSLLNRWLDLVVDGEEALRSFHGVEHNRKIEHFRELDGKLLRLNQKAVFARLAKEVPDPQQEEALAAQLKLLGRELKKKRRHLPLRTLFQGIKDLLPRLKPCLLMSPLSVAQYLDTELPPYDVIVFDEASQIPVWDAVGAIARGRAAIVVGDTKQLPPTSFFMGGDHDDFASEDEFEELESILDECVAAGLPQHRLLWHYRSRHESLITFSNRNYYDASLLTFPCAESKSEHLGVSLHPVPDGVYERTKSRTNRAEAEALVAEIVRRLSDAEERQRSIGVVTFSQAQQSLILDLLDKELREHPELEPFFSDTADEPVFVKNLENVQGDERDVILFSICYGPDDRGRVAMQFGPLNRRGGERRLNVAITRARQELIVFATLRPEQIDLSRTSSVAVKHLKAFLEFAARGGRGPEDAEIAEARAGRDRDLEGAIRAALVERGWSVDEQVGASGYKLDLAVVDPKKPERYLLGVECDGHNYDSARSARDRDRLRHLVLEQLGWRLHRIWSMDWWLDPKRELERLEAALRE